MTRILKDHATANAGYAEMFYTGAENRVDHGRDYIDPTDNATSWRLE